MDLSKILKSIQERQGQIRSLRAKLNAEEERLFRLRSKIQQKLEKK